MELGDSLTRWTVRLAVALYVLSLALRIAARDRSARLAWTAGLLFFLVHVACAFHFFHHWSHTEAYAETARQTAQLTGWNSGSGIYANYVFAVLWAIDVAWWWRGLELYRQRSRFFDWTIQGFMAFIVFNATVVFGKGAIRWFGVAACVLLAGVYFARGSLQNDKSQMTNHK